MTSSPPPPYQPPAGAPSNGPSGYPPQPPLGAFAQPVGRVPIVAALVPIAGVLALVGAFTPWFHGTATANGRTVKFDDALYSWQDGRIGLAPPILLVLLSVGIVSLMAGRTVRRFNRGSAHPVVSAARGALIVGAISAVCVIVAWFFVPTQYKFDDGSGNKISWNDALDQLHSRGIDATFSRGPQIGYFLTIAAAALALVAGVLMLLMRNRDEQASTFGTPGFGAPPVSTFPGQQPPGAQVPPAHGFGAPPSSYAPPAPQPAPPPVPGWNSPNAPRPGDDWSAPTSYPSSSGTSGVDPDGRVDLSK